MRYDAGASYNGNEFVQQVTGLISCSWDGTTLTTERHGLLQALYDSTIADRPDYQKSDADANTSGIGTSGIAITVATYNVPASNVVVKLTGSALSGSLTQLDLEIDYTAYTGLTAQGTNQAAGLVWK